MDFKLGQEPSCQVRVPRCPRLIRSSILPERIQLHTKLTKRCPHPSCRHLLIQPDTKSVRFKIKMVALNYLPVVEIGRRRRRVHTGDSTMPMTPEEIEQRRRERRRTRARGEDEEDEEMDKPLRPGEVVRSSHCVLAKC